MSNLSEVHAEPVELARRGQGVARIVRPSRVKAGQSKMPDFRARLRVRRSRRVFSAEETRQLIQDRFEELIPPRFLP